MNKATVYVIGVLTAVFVAVVLQVLAQDELGISQQPIVVGSLASAGILSLACAVGSLARARK